MVNIRLGVLTPISLLVVVVFLMTSCTSNNDVVGHHILQKRKYNKGWHFDFKKNLQVAQANPESPKKKENTDKREEDEQELVSNVNEMITNEVKPTKHTEKQGHARDLNDVRIPLEKQQKTTKAEYKQPKAEELEPQDGISNESEDDDVFVYMAFGALGIGLILCWYPILGIIFSVLGLIFAIVAIAKNEDKKLSSIALLVGIILTITTVILNVLIIRLLIADM